MTSIYPYLTVTEQELQCALLTIECRVVGWQIILVVSLQGQIRPELQQREEHVDLTGSCGQVESGHTVPVTAQKIPDE